MVSTTRDKPGPRLQQVIDTHDRTEFYRQTPPQSRLGLRPGRVLRFTAAGAVHRRHHYESCERRLNMTETRRRSAQHALQFEMPSPFKGLPRTGLPTTANAEVPSPLPEATSCMTKGQMSLGAAGSCVLIEQVRAGFAEGVLNKPSLQIIRQSLLDALEHIDAELTGKPTPFTPTSPPKCHAAQSCPAWTAR